MAANKHLPHILVLPEDDANRQLAVGFALSLDSRVIRKIQVLLPAGGWAEVLAHFVSDRVFDMEKYPDRLMVLLINFDGNKQRLDVATTKIPVHLRDRVFILGALSEPEQLKKAGLGSYEAIGLAMGRNCRAKTNPIWNNALPYCNATDVDRLTPLILPILF